MINYWQKVMAEGAYELRQGRYRDAAILFQEALQDAHVRHRIDNICAAKCQLAKSLCLMGKVEDGEKLYLDALTVEREHYQELGRQVPQALNGLIDLYESQKRLRDLEEIMIAQVEYKRNAFGAESKAYCSASLLLANICIRSLNQPDKAVALYKMGLNLIRQQNDPLALRIALLNYEQVLRTAGYEAEADSVKLELGRLNEGHKAAGRARPTYLDFRRVEYKSGRIPAHQFRIEVLLAIGGTAVNESPILEEFNQMRRSLGESPRDPDASQHWREVFADLISELAITDEEVFDVARMHIREVEESIIEKRTETDLC